MAATQRPDCVGEPKEHKAERQRGGYDTRGQAAAIEVEPEHERCHANPEEHQEPGAEQLS